MISCTDIGSCPTTLGRWRSEHGICTHQLAPDHLQMFLQQCILGYECGYREEDVMLKLTEACDASVSKLPATNIAACVEGVCIVWLALEQSGRSVVRWSQRVLPCGAAT